MNLKVKKRDGTIVPFNEEKIHNAITKAYKEVYGEVLSEEYISQINEVAAWVCESLCRNVNLPTVDIEQIQDMVEQELMSVNKEVAKAYITYRYKRGLVRESNTTDKNILELIDGTNDYWNNENSNKNAAVVTVQRDYLAGISSDDITKRFLLPKDVVEAHKNGIIHFHDTDYFIEHIHNCGLINLEDMLQNGTVINGVKIEKPHRLLTATTIATQIITAVTSSQYGGATISLTHLAPFVRSSYENLLAKYKKWGFDFNMADKYAMIDLKKEISDSVQTFNYQINSMSTTNGQAPFLSVFMYLNETDEYKTELAMLIEEFLKQRIQSMKNRAGVFVTQAFPKLLYVLEDNNIHDGDKYFYLTKLAAECTAKRMVPDYISEKVMKRLKIDKNNNGQCYPCMGCRSFLTPYIDENGKPKYYGRINQGVVTLNLPDIALSSKGDYDKFWELFEERTELCHKALRCRHERLKGTLSDVAPIIWQDGAYARLASGEKIDKLLYGGYSTISLGYAGLYECVKYMTGHSHTDGEIGEKFGLEIMQQLNKKCNQWREAENIAYSLYGTPLESTTYKFAKCLQDRFGVIEGITDRNYITNSYHIPVFEKIDPFKKLQIESKFQELSPGGAISYIECADLQNNIPAVIEVIRYIYDNIMYAELNTKSDYCHVCGYDGEIKIIDKNNELIWQCPNCGNTDKTKMNVVRRTCGYLGTNFWNQGRTAEIKDRYVHLDDHDLEE
ncbi:MAG: anaerobic ribonucleoside-triphosphate reductase [Oscillospiraceae bacterium]|nr:anaerobic ribonucleoside-triphosphate reductase [Oscillospiraceae bacterium]